MKKFLLDDVNPKNYYELTARFLVIIGAITTPEKYALARTKIYPYLNDKGLTTDEALDNLYESYSSLVKHFNNDEYDDFKYLSNNFDKLKKANLLSLLNDFSTTFRGKITHIYQIEKYAVIRTETPENDKVVVEYYPSTHPGITFESVETAMAYLISPDFYEAIIKLSK